jgi:NAD(P)-dependent dehydrogenase (short-subunit alcohol dehydrogenase family)
MAARETIISLTRSMAVGFGPNKVRLNAIARAPVDTKRMRNFLKNAPDQPDLRNRHRPPQVRSRLELFNPADVRAAALVAWNRRGVAAVRHYQARPLQRSRLDFLAGILGHAKSPFIDRFDVESPVTAYLESRQFLLPHEPVDC